MAVHAGLGRWNACKARSLDRCMAETAIDSQAGDVVLVAERHRLFRTQAFSRHPGRALQFISREPKHAEENNKTYQTRACVLVGTRWKELRHLTVFSCPTDDFQLLG